MQIVGAEGLTVSEVEEEVRRGGRFVYFPYCVSLLVVTLRRASDIHFIRAGEGTLGKSWPYVLLSFLLGWWGFPWGFVYTPVGCHRSDPAKHAACQVTCTHARSLAHAICANHCSRNLDECSILIFGIASARCTRFLEAH
jgi:hypothetical protein